MNWRVSLNRHLICDNTVSIYLGHTEDTECVPKQIIFIGNIQCIVKPQMFGFEVWSSQLVLSGCFYWVQAAIGDAGKKPISTERCCEKLTKEQVEALLYICFAPVCKLNFAEALITGLYSQHPCESAS